MYYIGIIFINLFSAYSLGKGAAAGAAGIGLGALCYYGLGLSNEASIQHNSL